jgi:phosphoglycolate phosphatase
MTSLHLLFDLDGTLTDSCPGIIRCINHALVELDQGPVPDERIRGMIGSHLSLIFADLFGTDDPALIDRAIAAYRERFNDVGIFENSLFPGIADALQALRGRGRRLQVVTSKPAPAARRVVEHFAIARHFDAVHGPSLDARSSNKADLVGAALRRAGASADTAVMIGDRDEDMRAACAHGVRAVGVGWGYGSTDELRESGAVFVAGDVAALLEWLDR